MKFFSRLTVAACLILLAFSASGCGLVNALKARDHLNKGVAAYTEQEFNKAIEEFRIAVELDPELVDAQLYLAHAYRAQYVPGIPRPENVALADTAIENFEKVIETAQPLVDEGDERARNSIVNSMASIADLYQNLDKLAEAKDWYRKRIDFEPENAEPHYGIGSLNHRISSRITGIDGSDAENLSPDQRTQAMTAVEEGIQSLQRAVELDEEYADAWEYLNLLYREKSYLIEDEDEKRRLLSQAFDLARKVIDLRRKQEREAEEERNRLFATEESGSD